MINPINFLQAKLVTAWKACKRRAACNLSFLFHDTRAAVEKFAQASGKAQAFSSPPKARKLAFPVRIA
jgi:hypothetical protein